MTRLSRRQNHLANLEARSDEIQSRVSKISEDADEKAGIPSSNTSASGWSGIASMLSGGLGSSMMRGMVTNPALQATLVAQLIEQHLNVKVKEEQLSSLFSRCSACVRGSATMFVKRAVSLQFVAWTMLSFQMMGLAFNVEPTFGPDGSFQIFLSVILCCVIYVEKRKRSWCTVTDSYGLRTNVICRWLMTVFFTILNYLATCTGWYDLNSYRLHAGKVGLVCNPLVCFVFLQIYWVLFSALCPSPFVVESQIMLYTGILAIQGCLLSIDRAEIYLSADPVLFSILVSVVVHISSAVVARFCTRKLAISSCPDHFGGVLIQIKNFVSSPESVCIVVASSLFPVLSVMAISHKLYVPVQVTLLLMSIPASLVYYLAVQFSNPENSGPVFFGSRTKKQVLMSAVVPVIFLLVVNSILHLVDLRQVVQTIVNIGFTAVASYLPLCTVFLWPWITWYSAEIRSVFV
jgi:hypothetical protein